MDTAIISHLVGSSQRCAISDDSLKDEDNAAWVMTLDGEARSAWLERIEWIRLADRLAENELVEVGKSEFQAFYKGWQVLFAEGKVNLGCAHQDVLNRMQFRWFDAGADSVAALSVQAWNRYLTAIARYHNTQMVIERLSQYTEMLEELAGSFFQVLPYLSERHWQSVYHFGAVDQFYNNLRDMREDAEQGICYFPTEILDRFGVTRTEILELRASQNPGYRPMMQFWVEDYLSRLYQKACRFIMTPDLHPSWEILRAWSLNRYRRIERVLRQCDYDYVQFPRQYWQAVRQDLFAQRSGMTQETTMASLRQMVAYTQSTNLLSGLEERLPGWSTNALLESSLYQPKEETYGSAASSFTGTSSSYCCHRSPIAA